MFSLRLCAPAVTGHFPSHLLLTFISFRVFLSKSVLPANFCVDALSSWGPINNFMTWRTCQLLLHFICSNSSPQNTIICYLSNKQPQFLSCVNTNRSSFQSFKTWKHLMFGYHLYTPGGLISSSPSRIQTRVEEVIIKMDVCAVVWIEVWTWSVWHWNPSWSSWNEFGVRGPQRMTQHAFSSFMTWTFFGFEWVIEVDGDLTWHPFVTCLYPHKFYEPQTLAIKT